MTITSTGNNFGAGQIEFKAVQNDNYIILNGNLPFDRSTAEYIAADVLEIYVPDMVMKRSMETAVFMLYDTPQYDRCGTIVRSWIKDRNTICLEKYPVNNNFTNFEFVFYCAYLPKGQRETFVVDGQIDLSVENMPEKMRCENCCAFVRDSWALICLGFENLTAVDPGVSFTADLVNFPTEISAELPMLAPMGSSRGWADTLLPSRIENGQLVCDGYLEVQKSQVSCGIIKAFIVTQ